jgi:hypothetical protein
MEITQDHEIIIKASQFDAICKKIIIHIFLVLFKYIKVVLDNPDEIFDSWINKLTHLLNWNTHFKEEK